MQSYSLLGYLNAVLRRSGRTLLVEGITDQSVMTRLKREIGATVGQEPTGFIDVAELISDETVKGLGKKEVIRKVLAEIDGLPIKFSDSLKNKLGVLYDREWDGLNVELQLAETWVAPSQESPYFVTTGHSVENYFFKLDGIESYLRHHFYAALDQSFFNALRERFHSIMAFAVTYSLAVRRIGAITRSGGLISCRHVRWVDNRYLFEAGFFQELAARGVAIPDEYDALSNQNIDINIAMHVEVEPGRWLCHGHLGEEAIWACIASMGGEFGLTAELQRNVERGYKDVRLNHAIDHLSRRPLAECAPLDEVIGWLTT